MLLELTEDLNIRADPLAGCPTHCYTLNERLDSDGACAIARHSNNESTVETILASLKVPKDVRSHLLSHGLGGVQNQHYDRHTYWPEMRQALKKWAAYLAKLKGGKMADAVESKDP